MKYNNHEKCSELGTACGGAYVRRAEEKLSRFGKPMVVIDFDSELTFAQMAALSEYFGTKDINFDAQEREEGYCETCRYSYTVFVATVMNPTKNVDAPTINPS